jgi:drug/metabolite transporter (DMT)-like permease
VSRRSTAILLMLAAIWGASYLLIKIGGRELSAPMISFLRIAFGAAVLVPLALRAGALRGFAGLWPTIAIVAVAQVAAPFLLIALGEEQISSSLAGILVASAPIFTAILAIFFDAEERSEGARLAGIVVGLFGLVLLLGLDVGDSTAELLGGLAVVLAGFGYAVAGMLAKHRLAAIPSLGVAAIVLATSAVISLPAAALTLPEQFPEIGPLLAVATLGVVGTGIAFAMFYELIATVGPARTFLVAYLAPVFAVAYGVLLLGERFTAITLAGLLLILIGSYLGAGGRLPGGGFRGRSGAELTDPEIAVDAPRAGR